MSLFSYKESIAALITLITLVTGFASLRFVQRYQHFLAVGDAFANGIFLGVAVFDIFSDVLHRISIMLIILPISVGFFLLFILEQWIIYREEKRQLVVANGHICTASSLMLVGILSVHAFIAGSALGVSNTMSNVFVLLIAILTHKGFESFVLIIRLYQSLKNEKQIKGILCAFSFVTPLGIILFSLVQTFFQTQIANLITNLFGVFSAGGFLYIGTLHARHNHFYPPRTPIKEYKKILTTLIGIAAMGIVAIFLWQL